MHIETKDITFIIQGPIKETCIRRSISTIRKYFPLSKIIISTWSNEHAVNLKSDKIIYNKDPGFFYYSLRENDKVNNINRQIVSTKNALDIVETKYVFRMRSDFILYGNNFLNYFGTLNSYIRNYKIFEYKVLIPSFFSRSPKYSNILFHPSDVAFFGTTKDIYMYFDLRLMSKEEAYWDTRNCFSNQFYPEQYLFVSFLKRNGKNIKFHYYNDMSEFNKIEYLKYLVSNFIVINLDQFQLMTDNIGFNFKKNVNYFYDIITHDEYVKQYNKIFNKHEIYSCNNMEKSIYI